MKQKHHQARRARLALLAAILLLTAVAGGVFGLCRAATNAAESYYRSRYLAFDFSNDSFDYSESTEKLDHPGGSFYYLAGYTLSEETKKEALAVRLVSDAKEYKSEELVLIEINLKNYKDSALSNDALAQTDQILQAWKDAGYGIILRFLYDWDGHSGETEPKELSLIQTHMSQLAPIVNAHAADIYTMQGIFVGDYAEMHDGNHMDTASMCTLAKHLDSVIDPEIFLSVRTPAQRRTILESAEIFPENSTLAGRLGLFNDGMLGSNNDLGTYGDTDRAQSASLEDPWLREQELAYQDELCRLVPNGGEAVIDNPLNDLEAAVETLSTMHVSYLNCMYHEPVINKWRAETIHTDDAWDGTNGYDYIDAHLGCRYRCAGTDATAFDFWSDDDVTINLTLTNTGFAPSYEPLDLTVSIVAEGDASPAVTATLPQEQWKPLTNGETCTLPLSVEPRTLAEGTYRVYLACTRVKDETKLAFATKLPLTEYGYEVASFTIDRTPTTIPSDRELFGRYLSHLMASEHSAK